MHENPCGTITVMNPALTDAINNIKTSKQEIFAHILVVFVLPIVFIKTQILAIEYRVPVLVALITLLCAIVLREKWTFSMLGINTHTFKKYFLPYTLFTIAGVTFIISVAHGLGYKGIPHWWSYPHFIYLFFIVSLFQEIGYRAYLIPALGKITNDPVWILLLNTILFTLLHTIFPNMIVGLPVAFVGGLGFALMYMKYPNLPLVVLSHSILNFCAVLYGFFVVPGITY